MKLREQVGQLLIMGFDGTSFTEALRRLHVDLQPGGVILFARNIESAAQTYSLLRDCRQAVSVPMFLSVDMEGGTVDRLKKAVTPSPSAAVVFETDDKDYFRWHGEFIGRECRALGFNADFAPCADLAFAASRSVLASRAVSDDPEKVIVYAREFLQGLRHADVLGCGKHFPGLGEANLDPHHGLPIVNKPWRQLWEQDLRPYRALHREMPFIMVAHANYPGVFDDGLPSSLSPRWITEVLRKKIGYRGLIISDDLEMGGVLAAGSVEHAAVETIRAGADIFLVCHKEEFVRGAFEAVLHEAERDKKFARRVAESARRILALKEKSRPIKKFPPVFKAAALERLRSEIQKFSEKIGYQSTAVSACT